MTRTCYETSRPSPEMLACNETFPKPFRTIILLLSWPNVRGGAKAYSGGSNEPPSSKEKTIYINFFFFFVSLIL